MKRDTNLILDEVLRRERFKKIKLFGGLALLAIVCGGVITYSQFRHVETTIIESELVGVLEAEQLTADETGAEKRVFKVRLKDNRLIEVFPSIEMPFSKGSNVKIAKREISPGRIQYNFVQ